jgi:hypothetical protein
MATAKIPVRDIAAEQAHVLSEYRRAIDGLTQAIALVEAGDDVSVFDGARVAKLAVQNVATTLYSMVRSSRTSYATHRPIK